MTLSAWIVIIVIDS